MKTASKVVLTCGAVIFGVVLVVVSWIGIVVTVSATTWAGVKGIWK